MQISQCPLCSHSRSFQSYHIFLCLFTGKLACLCHDSVPSPAAAWWHLTDENRSTHCFSEWTNFNHFTAVDDRKFFCTNSDKLVNFFLQYIWMEAAKIMSPHNIFSEIVSTQPPISRLCKLLPVGHFFLNKDINTQPLLSPSLTLGEGGFLLP